MTTPYPIDSSAGAPDGRESGPPETVRLRHPSDLPVAVPFLLGFHPAPCSLVVVVLHDGRVTLTVRVDGTTISRDDMPAVWDQLARPLAEAGVEHLVLLGYLPESGQDLLLAFAGTCPLPVLDVQRVHDGRWWSLTCPNGPDCCPPGQRVRQDPILVAPLLAATGSPAASREEVAACLRPGPAEQVSAVADLLPLHPVPAPAALFRAVTDAHTACEDGPIRLTSERAAVLLQALQDLRVRDLCCVWADDASWWLWTTLIRYAPARHVPPVAALIATTAYQRGDSVLARMAAEHALSVDPDYVLGRLVVGFVDAHIHPVIIREVLAYAVNEIAALPGSRDLFPTPDGTDPNGYGADRTDEGTVEGTAGGDRHGG